MAAPNNVTALPGADLPADQVLRLAMEARLEGVVVIGWREEADQEGNHFYIASSSGDAREVLFAIQHANQRTIEQSR